MAKTAKSEQEEPLEKKRWNLWQTSLHWTKSVFKSRQ